MNEALQEMGVPTNSVVAAVNKVGEMIRDASEPTVEATKLIATVTGLDAAELQIATLQDPKKAVVVAQHVTQEALKGSEMSMQVVEAGITRAEGMAVNPKYSFAFVAAAAEASQAGTVVATIGDQEVVVERKANGKIKKGGKQLMAKALFDANQNATTAELVAIFVKELGMTKQGATTYTYNCRKAAGLTSSKRGRKPGSKVAKVAVAPVEKKAKGRDKAADAAAKVTRAEKKAATAAKKAAKVVQPPVDDTPASE